jgi:hypothetical protein
MNKPWLIDRRTCLKGIGASLALPLLDTMGWAEKNAPTASKPPIRMGFMYMPHGVIMDQFWPSSPESFLSEPPPALTPLRSVLHQCTLMKGVSGVPIAPFNGAPHALELSTWLTANLPRADRRNTVDISISADQIAANFVGVFTPLPSLELATMPQTHKENQEGLHEAYYSHCSFSGPTQALPAETNPRNVLKRLFQNNASPSASNPKTSDPLEHSMLDLVLQGAKSLRGKLGQSDRAKLDEYLDSVRSLERRITAIELRQAEAAKASAGVTSTKRSGSDSVPIPIVIPEGDRRSEYMDVMCDLMALAFQSDTTRISTYIGSTPNGVSYPELGFSDQHHSQTHHNNEHAKVDKVAKITAFNIERFARMVIKMQSLREGNGTLLDNCIMMWGSGLEDGNKHTRANLPFILAGKAGGALKSGRFLPNASGNQGDLLGTLLTCAGIPLDRPIGIATKQFDELKA